MSAPVRDLREIVREEPLMRARVLQALESGPLTVPELAAVLGRPADEVVLWVMGMRKYGWLAELKDVTPEGYFRYEAIERAS